MIKLSHLFISLSLLTININAQNDSIDQAEDLLADLTEKWETRNIYAEYTESYINKSQDIDEINSGKIWIKNNMYRLERSNELCIINNGETLWYIMKDIPEVQIMDNDPEDKLNPTKIFSIYKEGYKYEYKGKEMINDNTVHLISFYPEESSVWKEIMLYIDTEEIEMKKIIMTDKEGGIMTFNLEKYVSGSIIDDRIFLFNEDEFSDIEIIDLR